MMRNKFILFLAGSFCLAPTFAHSQTGEVIGKVVSAAGQGIGGASVTLGSSIDTTKGRTSVSRDDGSFSIRFDWADVDKARGLGATWQISVEKDGYEQALANLLLEPRRAPNAVKIVLRAKNDFDKLMSKLDACANSTLDPKTLYLFDLTTDISATEMVNKFYQLLAYKLKNGVRTHLEEHGLLTNFTFEIKWCGEAPVRRDADAIFAAQRLGCPGVIWGFIQEQTNQFKSVISFTTILDSPVTDMAPVTYSHDISDLLEPSQQVNPAYLAFSCFVLGELYLKAARTNLAVKCFLHAKELRPSSILTDKADRILESLQPGNPARTLTPIGQP